MASERGHRATELHQFICQSRALLRCSVQERVFYDSGGKSVPRESPHVAAQHQQNRVTLPWETAGQNRDGNLMPVFVTNVASNVVGP